ncbi:hypothetical protein CCR95_01340 [Thiocystis minor]|uniref:P-loop NTPase n=1 Tax=Thiocystis minor TaxID=61597 RepID=UPI001913AA10|nr:P-loop NTPase [Thiocystis minor]MBK5962775.1 hypothetical protein [Thiocystis minor]
MGQIESRYRQSLEQIAEAKRLMTAAEHALAGKVPATILVTSATHGEGKTLCAATLAATAATNTDHRVAVLDLNWYRPALHAFFDLQPDHAAEQIFGGDLRQLMHRSQVGALELLLAPRDHADSFKFDSQGFPAVQRLIEQAKNAYDLVIIDSAPIFPTNRMMMDPVMLSGSVDGVVMVVLAEVTSRQQVRKANKIMEAAGANLLGVVTNQWQARTHE